LHDLESVEVGCPEGNTGAETSLRRAMGKCTQSEAGERKERGD